MKAVTRFNLSLNPRMATLPKSPTLEINEVGRQMMAEGKTVYRLGFGQSPFPVPDVVVDALRENAHQKDYLPVQGLSALRKAIAGYYQRRIGVQYDTDNIIIGPGSKELHFDLQFALDAEVLLPTPSWVSYYPQARIAGRESAWLEMKREDNFVLKPEVLDEHCAKDPERTRLMILNYPNNPTGTCMKKEELRDIARVCRKYKIVVLADEIYMDLHDEDYYSIAKYYPEGTILSTGLSKWAGAGGWRIGALLFPPQLKDLLRVVVGIASESFSSVAAPIQHAAVVAFNGGPEIDEYLRRTRCVIRTMAAEVVRILRDGGVTVADPNGPFYVFPDFGAFRGNLNRRGIYTSSEMTHKLLEETGVAVLPGDAFGRVPEELTVRVSMVDFDGRSALENADDSEAVLQVVRPVIQAMELVINWLNKTE